MRRILLLCLCCLPALALGDDVSKCRLGDGSVIFTDRGCPTGSSKEALSPGATVSVVDSFDIPPPTPRPTPAPTAKPKAKPAPTPKPERKCPESDERCVDDAPPQIMDESFDSGMGGYEKDGRRIRPPRKTVTPH